MTRLSYQNEIYNILSTLQIPFYFSKPVVTHMAHFIDGALSAGFTGKLTEIHTASYHPRHRTTVGHFLKKSTWNEMYLERISKKFVMNKVNPSKPLFLLLDDTLCQKIKPSSQANHPTESAAYHFSHTYRKTIYGHQVLQMMVKSNGTAYPYELQLFHKEKTKSKIDLSIDMIEQFKADTQATYVLCDTWFTSKKLIHASLTQGIHLIGGLKTNRILYPQGIKIQAKTFAEYIHESETDLVTVGDQQFRVYRYEGALNDIENAVILFSWKTNQAMTPANLRCFLSTDTELSNEKILTYYGERWSIETYFKQVKSYVGFDGYQIRSEKAIKRFWLLLQFTYLFAMMLKKCPFNEAIQEIRSSKQCSIIEFVYHQTKQGMSLSHIKNELKVA